MVDISVYRYIHVYLFSLFFSLTINVSIQLACVYIHVAVISQTVPRITKAVDILI